MRAPGIEQHPLGQRGLAGIDTRDDADIRIGPTQSIGAMLRIGASPSTEPALRAGALSLTRSRELWLVLNG